MRSKKFEFKFPKNYSCLLVTDQLGGVQENSEFCEDGWVRSPNGKKIKQWGGRIEDIRVNIPKQNDFKYLTGLYQKLKISSEKQWNLCKKYLNDITEKGGIAYAIPNHKYEKHTEAYKTSYWRYCVSNNGSFSFTWKDLTKEEESEIVNFDIGQKFYEAERRHRDLSSRSYKVMTVLDALVTDNVRKNYKDPKRENEVLIVTVYGLNYVFSSKFHGHLQYYWEKLNRGDLDKLHYFDIE